MSTEQNKVQVRRLVEAVLNPNNWDHVDEYLAPDFVEHGAPPGIPPNAEGVKQFFGMLRTAFPDFKYTVCDTMGDGDFVAQRVTGEGTMKGSFQGMPATGKRATWDELHIVRFRDGKIVEHWANVDQLGMLTQLGLAPIPGAS